MWQETSYSTKMKTFTYHYNEFDIFISMTSNCDEKGFQFENSPVSVPKKSRSLPGRISNSRESSFLFYSLLILLVHKCLPWLSWQERQKWVWSDFKQLMLFSILSEHSRQKALLTNALGEQWSEEDFLKYCGPYHPELLKLDSRRRFWVYCRCPKQMESTFWHFLLTH